MDSFAFRFVVLTFWLSLRRGACLSLVISCSHACPEKRDMPLAESKVQGYNCNQQIKNWCSYASTNWVKTGQRSVQYGLKKVSCLSASLSHLPILFFHMHFFIIKNFLLDTNCHVNIAIRNLDYRVGIFFRKTFAEPLVVHSELLFDMKMRKRMIKDLWLV